MIGVQYLCLEHLLSILPPKNYYKGCRHLNLLRDILKHGTQGHRYSISMHNAAPRQSQRILGIFGFNGRSNSVD